MARILLVEDDPALSRGIIALSKPPATLPTAPRTARRPSSWRTQNPAVWSYWISLARHVGIRGAEAAARSGCKTPILVLTARDHVTDRVKGLDLGADDTC